VYVLIHVILRVALYPGLLTPAFVTCSTNVTAASDKHWGEKAWVRG